MRNLSRNSAKKDAEMPMNSWKTKYRSSFIGRAAMRLGMDERGATAVEFAFIMPIMLTLYLSSMEVSQAFDLQKRVGRASSMVADIITQQSSITRAELREISDIGQSTLLPYSRSAPTIEMVGIRITTDNPPRSVVDWSLRVKNGSSSVPFGDGSPIAIPDRLKVAGTYVVRSRVDLDYQPLTTWTFRDSGAATTIPMKKTLYLRPRLVGIVDCTDC